MAGYRRTRLYKGVASCLIVVMVTFTASNIWRGTLTKHWHSYTDKATQTLLPTPTTWSTRTKTPMAPKVLCLILSSPYDRAKMVTVDRTWARRCDKLWFIFGKRKPPQNVRDPDNVLRVDVPESRKFLTQKMIKAFQYAYAQYNDTFDWILKCDVDTYIIMENLKYLLSHLNPRKPSYLGHHFKVLGNNGYMSGGAGYVISSRALHLLNMAFQNGSCAKITKDEDVYIGACLQNIGVPVFSSMDTNHMETFHTETLKDHLVPPYTNALWNKEYSWNAPKFGEACCSPYSISFHHLTADDMLVYEHLLYRTDVFGRSHGNGSTRIFNPKRVSNRRST